jgi:hypothetical protein
MANKRPITTPEVFREHPDTDTLICGKGLLLTELASHPSAPATGKVIMYVRTDGVLYIEDDTGTITPLT